MSEKDKLKVEMYDEVVKEKNKEYIELTCRFRETCNDIKNKDKEIERLKKDNEYLNKANIELSTEKNRLNNIINELEKYICAIEYNERHSDSWQIPVRIHNKLQKLKGSE